MENPSRPAFHSSGIEGFDWREASFFDRDDELDIYLEKFNDEFDYKD